MDSKLLKRLELEKTIHITTYNRDGSKGTVAMWFLFHQGNLYMSTGKNSVKVGRIARDPRVGLQLKDRKASMIEGCARMITEKELIRPVAEGLFRKYEGGGSWWGSVDNMVRGYHSQNPSVLLEITLEDS